MKTAPAKLNPSSKIRRRDSDLSSCEFKTVGSPLLQRILAARGAFSDADFNKALKHMLPATDLLGVEKAVELLCWALDEEKSILIVGDFDADGATSTALSLCALKAFGHTAVDFLVPNRFEYGYGLPPEIVEVAANQFKPDLIMTVDNGIASIEGVLAAHHHGIKAMVTDHHLPRH